MAFEEAVRARREHQLDWAFGQEWQVEAWKIILYFHFDELFYKKFSILILAYVILSYTADQDQSHVQY